MSGSVRGDSTYYDNVKLKGPHSHFEEVKLESNPAYETVLKPTSTNELQYEECEGGVTNTGAVAMEENPAYQSLDAVCTTKLEGPSYQNVYDVAS